MSVPTIDPLLHYKAKRDFSVTPEPSEGGALAGAALSFVVQKHWARSLHYDFRLELGGTLRSWAVPKGPSFDPKDKRMAVQVEDHPLSYAGFEGTIPAKHYGAGKVIVWDQGIWVPVGDPEQGLLDGDLKFELRGRKLHGRWVLVRMKGKGEKQRPWLLIKEKDSFARPAATYSVVDELPHSVGLSTPALASPATSAHRRVALPASMAPQLATLVDQPPADASQWLCEIKFDGYRLLARVDGADIKLLTRSGHDWTSKLASLHAALAQQNLPSGWYDGEIVVPNEHGVPDFGALQRAFESNDTQDIVFYVFDLPFFDGRDMRSLPLDERRAELKRVLEASVSDRVRVSEVFDVAIESVLGSACKLGLEGVIAKRRDSAYRAGRSTDWIKLKCGQRQEFVIGGYTDPQGARRGFGSLLLGVHDPQGHLLHAGNVGTGFSDTALQAITKKLDALARTTSPFSEPVQVAGKPHWVTPSLVAEVSFGEWTRDGHLRHSVFRGLRSDKAAQAIVREYAVSRPPLAKPKEFTVNPKPALSSRLHVTNPQRVIDLSTGTTKIELVRYYALVGDLMMPHLKGRPVALARAPDGVGGELFFQKHADTDRLPGIRQLDPTLYISHPPMLEVTGKQGLLSAAQWNVIEFHTLNTGTASFEHPDRMVFDLDPGAGVPWKRVQEAAELLHSFLKHLGLVSYLKTSGGKGLHVVAPLRKLHDWDTVKGFSHAVVKHMAATIPQRFVAKSGPKNRIGKVFIDYLRNGLGASTVCAWSARARPGLGISVPVAWSELGALKGGDHWTVRTVHARMDEGNDPWKGYARSARSLTASMKAIGFELIPI
jgi:bifunctional non-homologous end joining protein LigD